MLKLPTLPVRDSDGIVIPHDNEEIKDEHEVIRRISEQYIVEDCNGMRIKSSMAYKASSGKNGGMSVDLKNLIESAGLDPQEYVTEPRWIGSVKFTVSDLRKLDFKVGYHPTKHNPYHGEVWGKFSRSQINNLKTLAVWFVEIPQTNLV
jgi:hypothetical protein